MNQASDILSFTAICFFLTALALVLP